MMNKFNYIILYIILSLIICIFIYLYKKYRNTEPFYQINTIQIKNIVAPYNNILDFIDTSIIPKHGDIIRVNSLNKYEPYNFSKLAYTFNSILKLTSTEIPLLSTASTNNNTYNIPLPKYIIGNKISFAGLEESNNNGIITIDPNCNYKVTIIAVMYVNNISNGTNIDIIIYGNSTEIIKNSTYLYKNLKDLPDITMITTINIDKESKYTTITPKIRLGSGTYVASNNIDTTISVIVEEC